MRIELQNVRTSGDGKKILANVSAVEFGYSVPVSAHAELLHEWGADLLRAYLVKEAAIPARELLTAAVVVAEEVLARALDTPDTEDDPAALEALANLQAFEAAFWPELNARIDAFYSACKTHYADDADRAALVQQEWDAWKASIVDTSALAGVV